MDVERAIKDFELRLSKLEGRISILEQFVEHLDEKLTKTMKALGVNLAEFRNNEKRDVVESRVEILKALGEVIKAIPDEYFSPILDYFYGRKTNLCKVKINGNMKKVLVLNSLKRMVSEDGLVYSLPPPKEKYVKTSFSGNHIVLPSKLSKKFWTTVLRTYRKLLEEFTMKLALNEISLDDLRDFYKSREKFEHVLKTKLAGRI